MSPVTGQQDDEVEILPADGVRVLRRGEDRRLRRRRRRRVVIAIAVVVFLLLVGAVSWYELEAHPLGSQGRPVVVTISAHESAGTLIDALARDGVIGSALAFRISDLVHGTPTLLPGSYLFHTNQSFSTVRSILSHGPDVFSLQVLPGLTLSEVATRVAALPIAPKGNFLRALSDPSLSSVYSPSGSNSLEGTIATGSYRILPGESVHTLLTQMRHRFDRQVSAAHLASTAASFGITPSQLVIIASIVEKEGVYTKNMGMVARVIYNRLGRGMPLQMDATVLYAKGQDGGLVTPADLALKTPYNTYLHTGLPPTAICTPSLAALQAAAHPTPGNWLYFELVSKDGTLQFSDTFDQQLAAEALAHSRGLP